MGMRTELKEMASGFRWGRRSLVPRSAEPHTEPRQERSFPTAWARTSAAVAARQTILKFGMKPLLWNEITPRVHGLEHLKDLRGPVLFVSNHTSHIDATLIMTTLPDEWQATTAVGAAKDYFFDVWWRQAFTALVYAAFPIDRAGGGKRATTMARELLDDGWSLVVFPEGARSPDGHQQRFRHGASRLSLESGVPVVPIAIRGAYQAMPKGRNWPRPGRPPVSIRYGRPLFPREGETHQELSLRMQRSIAELHDEDANTWWVALHRAERGETPSITGPSGAVWRRKWDGSRPIGRRGPGRTWE
jgi:1-acyl-sn-glycerol-3-phosphate acyltransferase